MKKTSRLLLVWMLLVCMLAGTSLLTAAADGAVIQSDRDLSVIKDEYPLTFEDKGNGKNDKVIIYNDLNDNEPCILIPTTTARPIPQIYLTSRKQYAENALQKDNLGGREGTYFVSWYDPATDATADRKYYAEGGLAFATNYIMGDDGLTVNKDGSTGKDNIKFDYVSISFDVYLENPQSTLALRLDSVKPTADSDPPTPIFTLLLVDTDGSVYLRTIPGNSDTHIDAENDIKVGKLELGQWQTLGVTLYTQKGTVGYYDYTVAINSDVANPVVDENGNVLYGHTTYLKSFWDCLNFSDIHTRFNIYMNGTEGEPAEASKWAVDNVNFTAYNYVTEPDGKDAAMPTVHETKDTSAFVEMLNSSRFSPSSVINLRDQFAMINSNNAIQFTTNYTGNANNPADQKKGSFTNGAFSLEVVNGGVVINGGSTMSVLLNSANKYLQAGGDTYKVSFDVYGNPALTMKVGNTTLDLSGLALSASGWNTVEVEIGPTSATVGGKTTPLAVVDKDTQLSVTFPAAETEVRNISLSQQTTSITYKAEIGDALVDISPARAKYILYMQEKARAEAAGTEAPLAAVYGTADRTALRPVGRVQFDASTYYPTGTVVVLGWGTAINAAWINDVTFWGWNRSTLTQEEPTEFEENPYLNHTVELFLEDGAFVSKMNNTNDNIEAGDVAFPEDGLYFTSGFQFNLKRDQGVKEMESAYVSEYFRMTMSIWYDSVTFPEAGFTLRMGVERDSSENLTEDDQIGRKGLTGQIIFRIDDVDGVPTLTMPKNRYGTGLADTASEMIQYINGNYTPPVAEGEEPADPIPVVYEHKINSRLTGRPDEDWKFELDEGWNTIELEYRLMGEEFTTDHRDNTGLGDNNYTALDNCQHVYFETRIAVNGDYLQHNEADPKNGHIFYFDNGRNPTNSALYVEGTAQLHSMSTDKETELERFKVKDFKLEFLHDEIIDVNCFEKGFFADDVVYYHDFATATADELLTGKKVLPSVAGGVDEVQFIQRNERLIVTHKGAGTADVFYALANLQDKAVFTFDASLHLGDVTVVSADQSGETAPTKRPEKIAFMADENELVTINPATGVVSVGGVATALIKESGWNNFSICLELFEGKYLLTVYLGGEILVFRAETTLTTAPAQMGLRSTATEADQTFRLDNVALSASNIPTSLVYMHPVTYVTNGGEMAYDPAVGYHIIGEKTTFFPTVGKDNAAFEMWYFDQAFTAKAKFIRASYAKPVILYAKYNYQVNYTGVKAGDNVPATSTTYGDYLILEGKDVVYWSTVVDGKTVYFEKDDVFFVNGNTTFTAVYADEAKAVDYILAVDAIKNNKDAAEAEGGRVNYVDLQAQIAAAKPLGQAVDASFAAVIAGADNTIAELEAGLDYDKKLADVYLALHAILQDPTKTYAERRDALNKIEVSDTYVDHNGTPHTLGKDKDGNQITFRRVVDATIPGVSDVNDVIADYRRLLNTALETATAAVSAVQANKAATYTTLAERHANAHLVAEAYMDTYYFDGDPAKAEADKQAAIQAKNQEMIKLVTSIVQTDIAKNEGGDYVVVLGEMTVEAYLAEAKAIMDAYNATAQTVNGSVAAAQLGINTMVGNAYNASTTEKKVPAALSAMVESIKAFLTNLFN